MSWSGEFIVLLAIITSIVREKFNCYKYIILFIMIINNDKGSIVTNKRGKIGWNEGRERSQLSAASIKLRFW